MSLIPLRRAQQGIFEALASLNRAGGSGGGSGFTNIVYAPAQKAAGNQGAFATANASTWADITNSSYTLNVSRPCQFIYLMAPTAHITIGAGTAYVRGSISGFDVTASALFDAATKVSGFMYYLPITQGPIQPGSYTVKLQVATDAGTTVNIDQLAHVIILFAGV